MTFSVIFRLIGFFISSRIIYMKRNCQMCETEYTEIIPRHTNELTQENWAKTKRRTSLASTAPGQCAREREARGKGKRLWQEWEERDRGRKGRRAEVTRSSSFSVVEVEITLLWRELEVLMKYELLFVRKRPARFGRDATARCEGSRDEIHTYTKTHHTHMHTQFIGYTCCCVV